jgi:hypothetical protein
MSPRTALTIILAQLFVLALAIAGLIYALTRPSGVSFPLLPRPAAAAPSSTAAADGLLAWRSCADFQAVVPARGSFLCVPAPERVSACTHPCAALQGRACGATISALPPSVAASGGPDHDNLPAGARSRGLRGFVVRPASNTAAGAVHAAGRERISPSRSEHRVAGSGHVPISHLRSPISAERSSALRA